ncbi:MAG: SpoIIE family protein phosphatase [Sphingobacteriaceae bacterium]|nr:SpoIIE family protein phosphatase [Sphingobacteriaceae bacterium]
MAVVINMYENYKNQFLKELKTSKSELEVKSKELEVKNRDVTDSINYAKRIQYAVLPQEETIYRSIPLSFIFYKPKDIVSGDFFWFHEINKEEYLLVCADCTGHGVPGAFMTVIGSSLLNQTVIDNKIYKPSDILQELDKLINFTLKQQKDHDVSVQDGMDLTLIKVNKQKKKL